MKKILLIIISLSTSVVFSHGLMVNPPARNAMCGLTEKPDNATTPACIEAFAEDPQGGYKFMSVLSHTEGLAKASTLPANVCSFDSEVWEGAITPWDVPADWPANPVTEGPLDITWDIQWGPHFDDTREFHYWITKPDFVFDPTTPLTWDDFESEPFCAELYNDALPTANPNVVSNKGAITFTTTCQMPVRNGHHVIYGEWGRNQWTYERFHGCIDVAYGETNAIPPVAHDQQITLDQDTSALITLSATDSDGVINTYSVTSQPIHGTLTGNNNALTYTPGPGFFGLDNFQFTVTDNDNLTSVAATVSILVNKQGNRAPVADFSYSTTELTVALDGTTSTDSDNDLLSYSWSLGDGNTASGSVITHSYSAAGTYDIVLTVDDGIVAETITKTVTVAQLPNTTALCEYVVMNEWNGGFTAEIRIINVSDQNIEDWQVSWDYTNNTNLSSAWNANISGMSPIIATPLSWNSLIRPGQQIAFGIQGSYSGNNETPIVSGNICP